MIVILIKQDEVNCASYFIIVSYILPNRSCMTVSYIKQCSHGQVPALWNSVVPDEIEYMAMSVIGSTNEVGKTKEVRVTHFGPDWGLCNWSRSGGSVLFPSTSVNVGRIWTFRFSANSRPKYDDAHDSSVRLAFGCQEVPSGSMKWQEDFVWLPLPQTMQLKLLSVDNFDPCGLRFRAGLLEVLPLVSRRLNLCFDW